VFVDNGSTDGTREWLREELKTLPQARVLALPDNRGFAGGNNAGLAVARGRNIDLLNNDTIVMEGWLSGLLSVLDAYPRAGLVGPVTSYPSGPQMLDVFKSKWGMDGRARMEDGYPFAALAAGPRQPLRRLRRPRLSRGRLPAATA
jgi:GT2 family glycosyltransferase